MLDKHRSAGRSLLMSSAEGLANVLAIAVAFLLTPKLYEWTEGAIRALAVGAYGPGFADLASFGWAIICALTVFFIARAGIGTALMCAALALVSRLF
jgi:hypothetical protein